MSVKKTFVVRVKVLLFLTLGLIYGTSVCAEDIPVAEVQTPSLVVVLDPGHGGDDSGQRLSTTILEKEFTLKVAQNLKNILNRDTTMTVWLTRGKDTALSLSGRQSFANLKNPRVFISLHAADVSLNSPVFFVFAHRVIDDEKLNDLTNQAKENNLPVTPWEMAQDSVSSQSASLAKEISKALESAPWPQLQSFGVYNQKAPLTVLTGVKAPGVLVELPVPTTWTPKTYEAFCRQVAEALAAGINEFLGRR